MKNVESTLREDWAVITCGGKFFPTFGLVEAFSGYSNPLVKEYGKIYAWAHNPLTTINNHCSAPKNWMIGY